MISVLSTNFGYNSTPIVFKYCLFDEMVVLNGRFTVDPTTDEYKSVGVLRLRLPNLPITRSKETAVYVINTKDGAHDVTITKAWIENGNTICILPLIEYEPLESYDILLMSAFIPENLAGELSYARHRIIETSVTRGAATNLLVDLITGIAWAQLVVKAESLTFDETEEDVVISLTDFPNLAVDFLPIIYTNSVSDTYGSKFYPAVLNNGVLTISKDGSDDEAAAATGKILKAFLVTNDGYNGDNGDE